MVAEHRRIRGDGVRILVWLLTLFALACGSCATARPLRPLGEGGLAVDVSAPLLWQEAEDGTPFPVPEVVLGARLGMSERTELSGHLHLAPFALGLFALELGSNHHLLAPQGWQPGVILAGDFVMFLSPAALGAGDTWSAMVSARTLVHVRPLRWLWPYVLVEGTYFFGRNEPTLSVGAGVQFRPADPVGVSLELGIAAFDERTRDYSQPHLGIDGYGVFWLGMGVEYGLL